MDKEMTGMRQLTFSQKTNLVAKHVQVRLDEAADPGNDTKAPTATELAAIMVTSFTSLDEGDPLGKVMFDPNTKATAVREIVADSPQWRITTPGDPNFTYNTDPTLAGWTVIYDPSATDPEGSSA
jgi:hypothetical protein